MVGLDQKKECSVAGVSLDDVVRLEDVHGRTADFVVVSRRFAIICKLLNPTIFERTDETVILHGFDEGPETPQPENQTVRRGVGFWVHFHQNSGFRITGPIAQVYINDEPQFK